MRLFSWLERLAESARGSGAKPLRPYRSRFAPDLFVARLEERRVLNAPTLDAIADPAAINEDAGQQAVSLTGISDGEGGAPPGTQEIQITAVSDNQALIPNGNIAVNYTAGNTTGTLNYTPAGDQSGTATLTVTVTDGGMDGVVGSGGDDETFAQTFMVTVNPVNDEPSLTATADDPMFTEGGAAAGLYSGTSVDLVESGDLVQSLTLTVDGLQNGSDEILIVDGTNVALTNGNNVMTAANSFDVAVAEAGGTATVTITRAGNYTPAEAQTLVDGLSYQNSSDDPLGASRTVTLTGIQDDGGTANGGDDTAVLNIASTVMLTAVNDEPSLTATADDPTFTEGGAAAGLYSSTSVDLIESGDLVQSLTLTVDGLQNGSDEILIVDGTNVALTNGNNVNTVANGFAVNVVVAGSTATVTITRAGNYTPAEAQTLVDGLSYLNSSDDPLGSSRTVTLTGIQDDGGTANGGDDTAVLNIASTVTLAAVNDEPTLTATALNPTFIEGGAAVTIFSGTAIDTVESGQNLDHVVLKVFNVTDGGDEFLYVSGNQFDLTMNNSANIGGGVSVNVAVSGSTATVTVSKGGGGFTQAALQTLINGLTYENTSADPTPGVRTVTVTELQDTGSNTPPNDNLNDALNVASDVNVGTVNDPPTLSATGNDPTYTEGGAAADLYSGVSIDLIETGDRVESLTLTVDGLQDGADEVLVVDGTNVALTDGNSAVTAANGFVAVVSVAGSTATVTITRPGDYTAAEAQTLVDTLGYLNANDDFADGGMRTVTLTQIQDDGGTANGGSDTTALSVGSTVTLAAVNDEPVLTATADDPTFTEGGAAAGLFSSTSVDLIEAGDLVQSLTLTVTGLQNGTDEFLVVDGTNVALTNGNNVVTGANAFAVNVSVAGSTATVTITRAGKYTTAEAQTLVDGLSYLNTSDDPLGGSRTVTITAIQDDGGTANGGDDTGAPNVASTVTLSPVNDEPSLTATADDPTFTEGGPAAGLYSGANIDLVESGDLVQSLTLTVDGLQDGADETLVVDGTSVALTDGNNVVTGANSYSVGVTVAGNTATVTITKAGNYSVAQAQTLVDTLAYSNANDDPLNGGTRTVTLTSLQDDGGTDNGGDDTVALSIASTVTLQAVNDPPTLTATGLDPTFTEGGPAVGLYSGTSVDVVESGDLVQSLTLKVSGVKNGADEILFVDGTAVALTNGNNVLTAANAYAVSVSVAGTNATVVITRVGNFSEAEAQTLVDNLAYQNTSIDPLGNSRTVTLTQIQDDGGTANGGDDATMLSVDSTVTIVAVNAPPTLTATGDDPLFTEDGPAVGLYSLTSVDVVESGDKVQTIVLTVSGLQNGADEVLVVDGSDVLLTDGNNVATAANSFDVAVSETGGTATVTITMPGNYTETEAETLVDGLEYRNNSDNPLGATRTVTLTSIQDDGGTANGGNDTTALNVVSTVSIQAVNDAPVLQVPGAQNVDEDTPLNVPAITVSDPDAATLRVGLAVSNGTLTLGTTVGLTFVGGTANGQPVLIFDGSIADLNNALATLVYQGTQDFFGNDLLNAAVSDLGATGLGGAMFDADSVAITVNPVNDPPVVTVTLVPNPIGESSPTLLMGTITDVETFDTHTVAIDWGDGSPDALSMNGDFAINGAMGSFQFALAHFYADDPPGAVAGFPIQVQVQDSGGAIVNVQTTIIVINLPPQILGLSATEVTQNGETTLTGTYVDPGVLDSHTIVIDWGDGQATVIPLGPPGGVGQFAVSHVYIGNPDPTNAAAPIPIGVTVTDDDGGTAAGSTTAEVAGTGIMTVRIDTTPPIAELTVPPPPTISVFVDQPLPPLVIQNVQPQLGRTGPAQAGSEKVVLRRVLPGGKEDQQIRLDSEDSDPETVLKNLKETFKKLPDDHYRIYLIREDGTERLVLDVYLRDHKQVEADKLKDRTAKPVPRKVQPGDGKPDSKGPGPAEALPDRSPGDEQGAYSGVGRSLNSSQTGWKPVPRNPSAIPDPAPEEQRSSNLDFEGPPSGLDAPVLSQRTASLMGLALGSGSAGIRAWRRQMDKALAEWGRDGRRARTRRRTGRQIPGISECPGIVLPEGER